MNRISVIIPTLNEQTNLAAAIQSAWKAGADEVIVADGGSNDSTLDIAARANAAIVNSHRGRGNQLRAGCEKATGDVIVMLHGDSRLEENALRSFDRIGDTDHWGCFKQSIEHSSSIYRLIEFGNHWRAKNLGLIYGDQAMWIRDTMLENIGGIPPIPLMEDVKLSRLLSTKCRPTIFTARTFTSPRRWQQEGILRRTLKNWRLLFRYLVLRTPAEKLLSGYQPHKSKSQQR